MTSIGFDMVTARYDFLPVRLAAPYNGRGFFVLNPLTIGFLARRFFMLTNVGIDTSVAVNEIVGPSDRERDMEMGPDLGPFLFPAAGVRDADCRRHRFWP